jgi:hypothetical protein
MPDLAKLLIADEAEGILAWIVAGAIAWHRDDLGTCAAVAAATDAYGGRRTGCPSSSRSAASSQNTPASEVET